MGTASAILLATMDRLEYFHPPPEENSMSKLLSQLAEVQRSVTNWKADNSETKGLMKEIVQLAYDIQDTVESRFVSKPTGSFRAFRTMKTSGTPKNDTINTLQEKIENIKSRLKKYETGPDDQTLVTAELSGKQDGGNIHSNISSTASGSSAPVGLQADVRELLEKFINDDENRLRVVAMRGVGGIGKTTLARRVFNHDSVKDRFPIRAWAFAGVDFQARAILENILSSVSAGSQSSDKIQQMESMDLMEEIYKAFKGGRYLVVLDDIWSANDWQTLRFAFPDDKNGSRVIITSRQGLVDSSPDYEHVMRRLTEEESRELIKSRLGRSDLGMMEESSIPKEIVEYCAGLPLALVVISSLMRQRNELENWDALLQQLKLETGNEGALALSYNLLPPHLKPCFLYLGLYPTDHEIPVDKMFLLWIAEGFISAKDKPDKSKIEIGEKDKADKSKIEIAESYLKELVERSMVTIREKDEKSATGRSEFCQMHHLFRELCIAKGKEEEFLKVVDFGRPDKIEEFASHRLAIYLYLHENADGVSLKIPEAQKIRSLIFFEENGPWTKPNSRWPTAEVADLKEFRGARVLDFDGVDFEQKQLPKNIKKLVFLRYLSFRGCSLLEFPESFSSLSFLETLDLLVRESCRITIANVLCNFKRLRHLYLPVAFKVDSKSQDHKLMKLVGLDELEILENFHAGLCDTKDLPTLNRIKVFTGVVDGNNNDLVNIVKCLESWKMIRSPPSSLVVKNFDCYTETKFSIVNNLLTHDNAHPILEMDGHLIRLPSFDEISKKFTEMVLDGSELEEDPMKILGKLPHLRRLVLRSNAFKGKRMVCNEGDFRELRFLELANLRLLTELEVHSGAMPNLALLSIQNCKGLEMLPDKLMDITTLEEIKIASMPQKFQQDVQSMLHNAGRKVRVTVQI